MKKILKLLGNISIKRIIIYSLAAIMILVCFYKISVTNFNVLSSDRVYAAQAGSGTNWWQSWWWYKNAAEFVDSVIKILSWAWVVPAMVAGKLMNNDFVYGSLFHLDTYLWKMWNMMRSFANYTLAFLFIVAILKTFFKWEPMSVVKDLMPKILFSAVLIQASWFLLWAMIDLSTVLTAAVAAIPAKMIKEWDYKTTLSAMIKKIPEECSYNEGANRNGLPFSNCSEKKIDATKEVEDVIAPNYKSLNWPLIFLGYAVMKFHDYNFINSTQDSSKSLSITTCIEFIIILMFVLPIIILAIVNVLRVFYIRLWAVFSPFIVVFNVFGWDKNGGKMMSEIKSKHSKIFDIKNVVGFVFQPVAVVWTLSVAFILILGLTNVFYQLWSKSNDEVKKFIEIKNAEWNGGTISVGGDDRVTIKWSIVKNAWEILGWWLGYLILALFTIVLMWWVLRVWFHTTEITRWFADSAFNFTRWLVMAAPILPWWVAMWSLKRAYEWIEQYTSRDIQSWQAGRLQQLIESKLPNWMQDLNAGDMQQMRSDLQWADQRSYTGILFNDLQKSLKKSPQTLTRSSAFRDAIFNQWIKSDKWSSYIRDFLGLSKEEMQNAKSLDEILSKHERLRWFINKALKGEVKNFNDPDEVSGTNYAWWAPDLKTLKDTEFGS